MSEVSNDVLAERIAHIHLVYGAQISDLKSQIAHLENDKIEPIIKWKNSCGRIALVWTGIVSVTLTAATTIGYWLEPISRIMGKQP